MILCKWNDLPDDMRINEVRPYYETLAKKQGQVLFKRVFDFVVALIMLIIRTRPIIPHSLKPKIPESKLGDLFHGNLQIFCVSSFQGSSSSMISGLVRNSMLGRTVSNNSKYLKTSSLFAFAVSTML